MTRVEVRKAMITKIREHYAGLGIPLDDLSDRQIELGVRQLAAAARESGMSKDEAQEAMRKAVEKRRKNPEAAEPSDADTASRSPRTARTRFSPAPMGDSGDHLHPLLVVVRTRSGGSSSERGQRPLATAPAM